jgi:4-amino-4-deoxy-L-arabinose transferase-like glycosyltransferase
MNRYYYIAVLLLLPAALLINLGLMTFIDDEAIRSLVALEMKLSGNYITPTINGDYYYNKPPLYNWILLIFFSLAGYVDEWIARMPTVICLLGFAATVFYVFRQHYGPRIAFINALVLITCGRILFWDSMLGLIDICFSWVMFGLFMVVYHEFKKGNFLRLFLLSYLLTATGFMMKGLPALVFQAITLLVYFVYKRSFKRLLSLHHVLGIALLAGILLAYYATYHQYNNLNNVFSTLFDESVKRTGARFGLWETVVHTVVFPFEMLYHFLPWSLMILYLIRRDILQLLRKDDFMAFNIIVFLANIVVYWTSPEVYPRYLLMLAPLLFVVFIWLHDVHASKNSLTFRLIDRIFFVFLILIVVGSVIPLFLERTQDTAGVYWKSGFLLLSGVATLVIYHREQAQRLPTMIIALLLLRIGFNWFVLPDRNAEDWGNACRISSIEAARQEPDKPLYLYKDTELQMTNAFYLTNARQQIIRRTTSLENPGAVYILAPEKYPEVKYRKVGEFFYRHGRGSLDLGIPQTK